MPKKKLKRKVNHTGSEENLHFAMNAAVLSVLVAVMVVVFTSIQILGGF